MKLLLATMLALTSTSVWAACPDPLPAETMCVEWFAPTENSDGSPLTDLDGFKLFWDVSPILQPSQGMPVGAMGTIDIPDETQTQTTETIVVPAPPPPSGGGDATVDVHVRMLAYDGRGNESILSNEVVAIVVFPDETPPGAPTIRTFIINIERG